MSEPPHQEPTDKDFMEAHIATLEHRVGRLEKAFKRFGRHTYDCGLNDDTSQPTCTCGYKQIKTYLDHLASQEEA